MSQHKRSPLTCVRHPDMSLMPCSVLVLKKLGNELDGEFLEVIEWLGKDQQMQVGGPNNSMLVLVRHDIAL